MKEAIKVWVRNEKEIEEAIINGEEVEVVRVTLEPVSS